MDNLHQRDRVGVDDFVLLENFKSETSFSKNLKKRFKEKIIYTYIGQVLVSVNPYKPLPIYDQAYLKSYQNVNFYELLPHIFAIADSSFRSMVNESRDQCILISGESGSGKTEATKKILQYFSGLNSNSDKIKHINDKLIYSNPVLEAFGNSKTSRNDNSSRFGKYMDVEFDYLGNPIGGRINIYLLEKSRVVHQNMLERNFHIFYQMLKGLDDETLLKLSLRRDPQNYFYLNQIENSHLFDEENQFKIVQSAFKLFDFIDEEVWSIFAIIASILHLGNTGFYEEDDKAFLSNIKTITTISKLLECDQSLLKNSLLNRTIQAGNDLLSTSLNRDQAIYARDALAKAVYERLFIWLVKRLNDSLKQKSSKMNKICIGLLDIFGFEIFEKNNFEQFCINYCNEKLQQLFIELTLKQEQEEYKKEKIEWELVEYFNNKIICDLIDEKHKGIISFLDEECLRPGDASDLTLLAKLDQNLSNHSRFFPILKKNRKDSKNDGFKICHYAGDVEYSINGFLDKNNDLLFRDLIKTMCSSKNIIMQELFELDELTTQKRPVTTATQFQRSLSNLMSLLSMKEPWYIRCIKPNNDQRPEIFDELVVQHQIKYLGLMENLRVRRAGFSYRRPYQEFLQRYKCLSPKTWPFYQGTDKKGVQELIDYLQLNADEYKMGLTKIFIRNPRTLFKIEDSFQQHKNILATKIQSVYKGYRQKKIYNQILKSVILIQKNIKRVIAKKKLEQRRHAAMTIRKFIKGFITRNDFPNIFNQTFILYARNNWIKTLANNLPTKILNHDLLWPTAPKCCSEVSKHLKKIHQLQLVRNYVLNITPKRKEDLKEKVLAEKLFKNKKKLYDQSISELFENNRLDWKEDELRKKVFELKYKDDNEKTQYCAIVNKYDRHGYQARSRVLIITNHKLYLLDRKKMTVRESVFLNSIKVIVSNLNDGMFIVKIPIEKKEKGDLILEYYPRTIEILTKLIKIAGEDKLMITDSQIIEHFMADGRKGQIYFKTGSKYEIIKRKEGHLLVTSISP